MNGPKESIFPLAQRTAFVLSRFRQTSMTIASVSMTILCQARSSTTLAATPAAVISSRAHRGPVIALPWPGLWGASELARRPALWSAAIIGLVTALFGGHRPLIPSPPAMMGGVHAVLANASHQAEPPAPALRSPHRGDAPPGVPDPSTGVFRLGRYIKPKMPYTVISGFHIGIPADSESCLQDRSHCSSGQPTGV